jgi:hypothetical protein
MRRNLVRVGVLACVLLSLAACGTRSISNSAYEADSSRGGSSNGFYRGELSEMDVLGVDPAQRVTEADIQRALQANQRLVLDKGAPVLLIQSGATFPDAPMVEAMRKHYAVTGFSGVPQSRPSPESNGYAMQLRLAAAKGGYDKIIAYWGVLETAREGYATKLVSWVPIIGWAVPDEQQRMRIRLKMAIIDVQSGRWEMFNPADLADEATSAGLNRVSSDQGQVALLKDKAYAAAADEFAMRFAPRTSQPTPANKPLPQGPQISL